MKKRGFFITLEGGDGTGKTTLMEYIARKLTAQGHQVVKTREPGGTKLGEEIRGLLLQKKGPLSPYAELSLFLAARAQHIFEVIAPALAEHKIVLCDRFNDSSIAYQGIARGLGRSEVAASCAFFSEGLTPHLTLLLDLDPKLAAKRSESRHADRIEAEGRAFQEKVRQAYLELQKEHIDRMYRLDAALSPHELCEMATRKIETCLKHF
jgi:dTMP kinase